MAVKRKETLKLYGKVDLHIHSYFSDGSFSPEEIIRRASIAGLRAISIADHDNVKAIDPAFQAASVFNIEFIPGIEISARHEDFDLHMLGYFFDHKNQELLEYIKVFQHERKTRAAKIVERLNDVGVPISINDVIAKAGEGAIGRPHLVDVLVEQGYVKSHAEAFEKYLGDQCPTYVPKFKISPEEAIQIIHHAQGLIFIAHPGLDLNESGVYELIKMGVDGIETIHTRHMPSDTFYYRDIVNKYKLLESGGSDCHGDRREDVALGKVDVSYRLVEKMKSRIRELYPNHHLVRSEARE
ncbi:PHP domain-containing protein [candidate division KSB1 bacterium]|nr:PHP domain-containing protein [candidate division KSB1 bacterium]